jgi:ABC-type uncharacterized transport system fused permease/ATPase subunit
VLPPAPPSLPCCSQRPYLVSGTLRDQLLYPEPPQSVWGTASRQTRARVEPWMKSRLLTEDELEQRLRWVGGLVHEGAMHLCR